MPLLAIVAELTAARLLWMFGYDAVIAGVGGLGVQEASRKAMAIEDATATFERNIEAKTDRPVAEWIALLPESGSTKHGGWSPGSSPSMG